METYTFLVSDESVNSKGVTVITKRIDTSQLKKNPIMLYMHERPHIIGLWENLKIEDDKMYADAIFDTDDSTGKEIERKVAEGFLKSASVGLSYNPEHLKNEILEKSVLQEISIVDLGSNKNALKLYDEGNFVGFYFQEMQGLRTLAKTLSLTPNP